MTDRGRADDKSPAAFMTRRAIFVPCSTAMVREVRRFWAGGARILAGRSWSGMPSFVEVCDLPTAAAALLSDDGDVVVVLESFVGFGEGFAWEGEGADERSVAALARFAQERGGREVHVGMADPDRGRVGIRAAHRVMNVSADLDAAGHLLDDWSGPALRASSDRAAWRRWRRRRLGIADMILHLNALDGRPSLLHEHGAAVAAAIAEADADAPPRRRAGDGTTPMERDSRSTRVEAEAVRRLREPGSGSLGDLVTVDASQLLDDPKGAIVCTPHVGPFVAGFLALLGALRRRSVAVMFEDPALNPFNALWQDVFASLHEPPRILTSDRRSVAASLRHLASGGILCVMPDLHDERTSAVTVELAGRLWSMPRGIGWLSARAAAPIWYGALRSTTSGRFEARLERRPLFAAEDAGSLGSAAYLATLDLARAVSETVVDPATEWPLRDVWRRLPPAPVWPVERREAEKAVERLLIGV